MPCPTFDTLLSKDSQDHLLQCEACNTLVRLRSLERPNPEQCEKLEGLFGILDALADSDRKSVDQHLAVCPACALASTLSEPASSPSADTIWKGPAMDAIAPTRIVSTSTALLGGLAFAALAVVVVLTLRTANEADTTAQYPSLPQTDTNSAVAKPEQKTSPLGQHLKAGSSPTAAKAGANRPAQVPTPRTSTPPSTTPRTSVAENTALPNSSGELFTQCSAALKTNIRADRTAYTCALAFASNSSISARLAETIGDAKMKRQLKKQLKKVLTEQKRQSSSCDEITCLVNPKLPCCLSKASANRTPIVEKLNAKAREYAQQKRFSKARTHCQTALLFDPKNDTAHLICGISACNQNQFAVGLEHAQKISVSVKQASVEQICYRLGAPVPKENK